MLLSERVGNDSDEFFLGCLNASTTGPSHAHVGPSADSCRRIDRRTGSAAACSNWRSGSMDRFMSGSISIDIDIVIPYIDVHRYDTGVQT